MHNPPHPGEFIIQVYLDPNNLSGRELAGKLGVAASTLNRILMGTSRLSPEIALRLSRALGRKNGATYLAPPPSERFDSLKINVIA